MDSWSIVLYSFSSGLPYLLSHFFVACLILALGIGIYVKTTKHNEFALIRSGNLAACIALGGTFISLSLPLSSSLAASLSIPSICIWGFTAIILQLLCDRIASIFIGSNETAVAEENYPPVITLACCKISVAMLNSAVISG